MQPTPILEVVNVSKQYKSSSRLAVNNVSFSIAEKEVFGILGPNGAGKTTTISLLVGLFPPSSGEIFFKGDDLQHLRSDFKSKIGVVPQDIALYPTLTGRENLAFYGAMYGVEKNLLHDRIESWLEKLEMKESADRLVATYSGGMKRRINLIAGILHQPELLFLDEPTVGVDVQSRASIMNHLNALNQEGMTIIYTSHHMEEAEKLCTDVAIIDAGKIIARGNPSDLIAAYPECTSLEDVFLLLTVKSKNGES